MERKCVTSYFHFLNYPHLHRAYPLHRRQNGPSPRFSIRRPCTPHKDASPWCTLRCDATCHHRFPLELPSSNFEAQTQQNPPSVALGGFDDQTTKPPWLSKHVRAPHVLDTCHASPRPSKQHVPMLVPIDTRGQAGPSTRERGYLGAQQNSR
jgi:hypothetical protein